MKFCYLDETGTGQDTVIVIVGIIIDIQRMSRTKQEWHTLFESLTALAKKSISEIHATNLMNGNDAWRNVSSADRDNVVSTILDWLIERKHHLTFSAIDRSRFKVSSDIRQQNLKDEWNAAAFHLMLSIQRAYQKNEKNKGNTLFIFDKGKESPHLHNLVQNPPEWSDTYYDRDKKQERLDQIIDVPFFADSRHIPLIQIADLIGYILRRWADLNDYGQPEKYAGERAKFEIWISKIQKVCLQTSHRYRKREMCETDKFYAGLAPESLRKL